MQGVALYAPREAALQVEMLFQVVKDGLNLGSALEKPPLAARQDLLSLDVI